MPNGETSKSFIRRYRKSLTTLGITAALFGLIIALAPFGIQYAAVSWLENDGERTAAIENVDFNPFTGELLIEKLAVTDPSGRQLNTARLFLAIEYAELFSKRLYLRTIELQGGRVEIELGADGTVSLAGLPTPAEPDPADSSDATEEPSEWQAGIGALDLESVAIRFHQKENQETIEIRKFQVGGIAPWNVDASTPVATSFAVGDAGIEMTANVGAFGDTPSVNMKLDLKSVDLGRIKKFAAGTSLKDIAGELSAALDIRFALQPSGGMSLGVAGSMGLDNILAQVQNGDDPNARLTLKRARLTNLDANLALSQGQPEKIEWRAGTRFDGLNFETENIAFAAEAFEWTGTLDGTMPASKATSFQTKGNVKSTAALLTLDDDAGPTTISVGQLAVNNLVNTVTQSQNGDLSVETTLGLVLGALKGTTADLALTDEEITWKGRIDATVLASGDTTVKAEGDLETLSLEGSVALDEQTDGPPLTFSTARIAIDKLVGELRHSKSGDLTVESTAGIWVEKLGLTADGTALKNEAIEWKGKLDANISAPDDLEVLADGKLDNSQLQLELASEGFKASQARATWEGRANFRANPDVPGDIEVQTDGKLSNSKLQLELANEGLKASQASASWEGQFDYRANGEPALTLTGNADTTGIQVDSAEAGLRILSLSALNLDSIAVNGTNDIRVGRFTVGSLEAVQALSASDENAENAEPYTASLSALTAEDITVSDSSHTKIRRVALDGADIQLVRQEDGEFKLVGSLLQLIGRLSEGDEQQAPQEDTPMQIEIGSWEVIGNSQFSLTDQSVKPPVKVAIGPIAVRLQNINSATPDEDVPIELTANFGKYSNLDLKGGIKPFLPRLNVDVAGKLSGFDLTALSGYVTEHMGYDLTRGKIDTDTKIQIVDGTLQTESALTISKLLVKPTDPTQLDPLKERLQLPLETALSLLQDSDEIIRLQVPITGDVANPDFDFSDAINTAIGNAMKKTVLATLKLAFPLGGIITAISDAQDEARLGVEPVAFTAGSAALTKPAEAHLSKVAEFLNSRPTVKITICGWATKQDQNALIALDLKKAPKATDKKQTTPDKNIIDKKQLAAKAAKEAAAKTALLKKITEAAKAELPALGKHRGEAVKDQLINKHGIAEARLFLCAPQVSDKEEDAPRVALFL